MRKKLLNYLKGNPKLLDCIWKIARVVLNFAGVFIPLKKTIVFASFGGRKFDDSPKALYDEIVTREEFKDWKFKWAFVNPDDYEVPQGDKIKIDTPAFFYALLSSRVWISNSGMDRGIGIKKKGIVKVETWHGTPLKKIGGDEHTNSMVIKREKSVPPDRTTIRCAQSEYDRDILARIEHASKKAFIMRGLPRNDALLTYDEAKCAKIRHSLGIRDNRKILLYTPTYREYLINSTSDTYIAPPIHFDKWEQLLGSDYILLIRAHYAVTAALKLPESDFVTDVSEYPYLNDLYAVADAMISDYSSTFFDYSVLNRPVFCFAYDLEEYKEKRGLYVELEETLPCRVDRDEEALLDSIINVRVEEAVERVSLFRQKYAPHEGHASKAVVNKIIRRLGM